MAHNYTLDDVETLRSKSGVSYEEAVSLLDKYDGDVARALIELEKRGQLDAKEKQSSKYTLEDGCAWVQKMWMKGLKTRVVVERKGERLISLSVLFLILMLILGPYAMVAAAVLMLLTGCSVSIQGENDTKQTILKGEEAEAGQADPADSTESTEAAPAQNPQPAEDEEKPDDDFPSITIS